MPNRPLALVTGGAGLIGSHLGDLLLAEGWRLRILDNLEPRTHGAGVPDWIPAGAEAIWGDIRDPELLRAVLEGVDTVFHLAAYGGSMPEIAKFVDVNSLGTARLLETIRDGAMSIRKLVVASSQVVYTEGAVSCTRHGRQFPLRRDEARLAAGRFEVPCPVCGGPATSVPTPESAPVSGDTVYALTKLDQERLTLTWSRQTGIPAVALRFPCTYGPRQSPFNPYTGVISIFCNHLLNDRPPVLYEDGNQTRDLCYVGDVARACLLAASSDRLDGLAVNVGSGRPTSVRQLAETIARMLGSPISPEVPGLFRPGEMRALVPDLDLVRRVGFEAEVPLELGIASYIAWVRKRGVEERVGPAVDVLRSRGMVQAVAAS